MQDVHAFTRLEPPFTTARTLCKLTFQRRLVTLWAWLMRLPNCGPRPQISQFFAIRQGSPSTCELQLYQSKRVYRNLRHTCCLRLLAPALPRPAPTVQTIHDIRVRAFHSTTSRMSWYTRLRRRDFGPRVTRPSSANAVVN